MIELPIWIFIVLCIFAAPLLLSLAILIVGGILVGIIALIGAAVDKITGREDGDLL